MNRECPDEPPSIPPPRRHGARDAGRRRRILHVVRQFQPSVGGLETYVMQLASLQAVRDDVTVLTLDRVFGDRAERLPPNERVGAVQVERVPFVGWRSFFLPWFGRSAVAPFDMVHVHATDQMLDLAGLFCRLAGRPYVVTTHGLFFHTERLRLAKAVYLRTFTRWALTHARAVFAVSGNDARILDGAGIPSVVLRNPIVPLGEALCRGRDLLYLGRLAANKRLDLLLRFFAAVRAQDPSVRLHVVGSDGDGLWPALLAEAPAGARDGVVFHGFLSPDALAALLPRCGFSVSASRFEGFGLSIVEGMSVGLLPVTHDNAAFRETRERSGLGLLADFDRPDDAAQLFLAWRGSVSADDRRRAQDFAREQSWPRTIDLIEEHYGHADTHH